MAADESGLLEHVNDYVPPGVRLRPYTPDVLLEGDETLELAGISFETLRVPGHSPAHLAFAADGALFSGDVLFAGSVGPHRSARSRPGHPARLDPDARRALPARRPSSTRATARRRRSGTSSRTNPFLAELRAARR